MSLTSFLEHPEVRARLKPLRPSVLRKISVPLLVPPRSRRYALVGIAFDYLLRFEIERRASQCISRGWVAEQAPGVLEDAERGSVLLKVLDPEGGPPSSAPPPGGFRRASRRVRSRLSAARDWILEYITLDDPDEGDRERTAACAIELARLDLLFRAHAFDPEFERVETEDVADVLAMLDVTPPELLSSGEVVHLNPTFGEASELLGGADADLILGDLLIDVKASKQGRIPTDDLDQLLGYFLLARRARAENARFPLVRRLGHYSARFAHLVVLEDTSWTEHPLFLETEGWFFARAEQERDEEWT